MSREIHLFAGLVSFSLFIAACSSEMKKQPSPVVDKQPVSKAQVKKREELEIYYEAVKRLKNRVLLEQQRIIGTPSYNAQQALWAKLKRQMVDRTLHRTALIQNNELFVRTIDVDALSRKIVNRIPDLVHPNKKLERIVSAGYAESKIHDILRKAGYRNSEHIKIITRSVKRDLKIAKQDRRIPLATLEELTVRAMKNFKKSAALKNSISRLAAEVLFLKAIKAEKFTTAQEVEATNLMTDAINSVTSRELLTHAEVQKLIVQVLKKVRSNKNWTQKDKKRGQKMRSGRWGKSSRAE